MIERCRPARLLLTCLLVTCLAVCIAGCLAGCGGGGGGGGSTGGDDWHEDDSSSSGGPPPSAVRTHARAIDHYGGPVLDIELPDAQDAGGAYVASADIDGDGYDDVIVGPARTRSGASWQTVRVFDGYTGALTWEFQPFEDGYTGGLRVAAADVDGDSWPDVIVGRGPGAEPQVTVFSGLDGRVIMDFLAYDRAFQGGVFVAGGDLDQDGFAEVVTAPGPGMTSDVNVFAWTGGGGPAFVLGFQAYEPAWTGGASVAVGFVTTDVYPSIITGPGPGGKAWVSVFDGTAGVEVTSFLAYDDVPVGGTFVGAGDVDGDGQDEVITAGGVRSGQVRTWRGDDGYWLDLFDVCFSSDACYGYGLSVASGDLDGDGFYDMVVGTGLTDAQ